MRGRASNFFFFVSPETTQLTVDDQCGGGFTGVRPVKSLDTCLKVYGRQKP